MQLSLEFPGDEEFARLLARQPDVDLTLVALELARDAYPELSFQHTLEWLARRGRELPDVAIKAPSDRVLLRNIGRCLSGTHGLHGDRVDLVLRRRAGGSHLDAVAGEGAQVAGRHLGAARIVHADEQHAGRVWHGRPRLLGFHHAVAIGITAPTPRRAR